MSNPDGKKPEDRGSVGFPYKPGRLGFVHGPIGDTDKMGILSIVYHLPLNLAEAMYESYYGLPSDEQQPARHVFTYLLMKAIKLFIGFQQASKRALEETYMAFLKRQEEREQAKHHKGGH